MDPESEAGGDPVPQIIYDAFSSKFGPPAGVAMQIIPILGVFFCMVATHTYVARWVGGRGSAGLCAVIASCFEVLGQTL